MSELAQPLDVLHPLITAHADAAAWHPVQPGTLCVTVTGPARAVALMEALRANGWRRLAGSLVDPGQCGSPVIPAVWPLDPTRLPAGAVVHLQFRRWAPPASTEPTIGRRWTARVWYADAVTGQERSVMTDADGATADEAMADLRARFAPNGRSGGLLAVDDLAAVAP